MRQSVKACMRCGAAIFGLVAAVVASPVAAHEVRSTHIKLVTEATAVEIWQTTSADIAHGVAARLMQQDQDKALSAAGQGGDSQHPNDLDLTSDEGVVRALSGAWHVSDGAGQCALTSLVHRRTHHGSQLEVGYRFECQHGLSASHIAWPWLVETPQDHFVLFEHHTPAGVRTKIIQRSQLGAPIGVNVTQTDPDTQENDR